MFSSPDCRDILLPMMLRELSGALAVVGEGHQDEKRNSVELLNNILEVLSRNDVVRANQRAAHYYTSQSQHSQWISGEISFHFIQ